MYFKSKLVLFPIYLITVLLPHNVEPIAVSDVVEIIEVSNDIAKTIFQTWKIVETEIRPEDHPEIELPFVHKRQQKVLKYIRDVSRKLSEVADSVNHLGPLTIDSLLQQFPSRIKFALRQNDLADMVTRINVAHRNMMNYMNTGEIERVTLEDFIMWVVSHDSGSVKSLLTRINYIIAPEGEGLLDRGILQYISTSAEEANSDLCNLRQSPQQLLYNLYTTLALTELKGYAMMQFSYMLMRLYNKGNMTREVELMKEGFEERSGRMIDAVRKVMQNASRDLWICDPKKHIEGETYEQVTELLQGFIVNEVDLNPEGTCRENCPYYYYTKVHGCFKDLYCAQQRTCKGKVVSCEYFDADMWICPGQLYSGRRYEYIEYENGRVLGKKEQCTRGTTKVDSWWRWLFWRCSYCFCLCDEQGRNSDRYVSMRNVVADIENNRVITGLRFTKVNRIIHLQIQQGELLPKGQINDETLEWVAVDNFSVMDKGVYSGQDYHTLTWESRAIDLDDLVGQPNQVLTGVRFRKIGQHLHFEIQVSPFNFSSGLLIDPKNKNEWISNDKTEASAGDPRSELRISKPDVPTRSKSLSAPDSRPNQFLHFVNTDLDKDAAQTTVPFLDAQRVASQVALPLSGAGIYHKGQIGFGGFIAPKIITFDYTPHLIKPTPKFNMSDISRKTSNKLENEIEALKLVLLDENNAHNIKIAPILVTFIALVLTTLFQ